MLKQEKEFICDERIVVLDMPGEIKPGRPQTLATKTKISQALKGFSFKTKIKTEVSLTEVTCPTCKKVSEYLPCKAKRQKCCSRSCAKKYQNLLNPNICKKAGLASATIQSKNRRSKNEAMFAELCKSKFDDVLTNISMFEGWDADVIIPSLKLAILWNGAWHYKQISKTSSLLQIQNRDKIKLDVISRCGYIPYVIVDMGKHDKEFVNEQFRIFLEKHCAGE